MNSIDELVHYIDDIGDPCDYSVSPDEIFTKELIDYLHKNMEWDDGEVGQGGSYWFIRILKLEHIILTIEGILWGKFDDLSSDNVFTKIDMVHL